MSAAIESNFSAKEKGMKKDKIRKNAQQNERTFPTSRKQPWPTFSGNTSTISKNPISTNQATISLTQPNPRIDYSPFSHLQSLTQLILADQIQHNLFSVPPQSILSPTMIPLQSPVSQQMK